MPGHSLRGDLGRTGQRESQETKRKHKGAVTHRWPRVERKGRCTKWWAGCGSRSLASEDPGLRAPRQRHTGHGAQFGLFQVKRQLLLHLDGLEQPSNCTLAQVFTSSPASPSTGRLVPGEQTKLSGAPVSCPGTCCLEQVGLGLIGAQPCTGEEFAGVLHSSRGRPLGKFYFPGHWCSHLSNGEV